MKKQMKSTFSRVSYLDATRSINYIINTDNIFDTTASFVVISQFHYDNTRKICSSLANIFLHIIG